VYCYLGGGIVGHGARLFLDLDGAAN
jgi:hypothetical protein